MNKSLIGVLVGTVLALGQTPDPRVDQGRALLDRAREAIGADKLAAIRDFRQTTKFAQGDLVIEYVAPDHFRIGSPTPSGPLSAYFNDVSGWSAQSQSVRDFQAGTGRRTAIRLLPALLLPALDGWRTVKALDAGSLEIWSGGANVRVAFDAATGFPTQMYMDYPSGTTTGPAPPRFRMVETYSDWRDVDGVKLPFRIVVELDGQKLRESIVTEYKINSGLTAQELGKRP